MLKLKRLKIKRPNGFSNGNSKLNSVNGKIYYDN